MNQEIEERVTSVRSFNRFYTREIGVITDRLLDTPYSLSQARILFELAHEDDIAASSLAERIRIDKGYVSRMIKSMERGGLIKRTRSKVDGRVLFLRLTGPGRQAFATLNQRSAAQIRSKLKTLPDEDQIRLLRAMAAIETILNGRSADAAPIVIRNHRPGDVGWIIERHGSVYNQEYNWDHTFEALVAEILAKILGKYDHRKDQIWIAEIDGARAGTVSVTSADNSTAQLRLLLVEPWARGHGIGKMLVDECLRFSKQAGYKNIILWTQSILTSARRIYDACGFELDREESHHSFGHDLTGQFFKREL